MNIITRKMLLNEVIKSIFSEISEVAVIKM